MADKIEIFKEQYPSLESYWRSIILFGRNVASYKFALAKSLLEIAPTGQAEISLEELAEPYSRYLCEHLKHSPKQVTSASSKFLDACVSFNNDAISKQELIDTTVRLGFNNVIDAFHVVNNDNIPIAFFEKDYTRRNKKIILTDHVFDIVDRDKNIIFEHEAEARWRLVETAWELGVARNVVEVRYDDDTEILYVNDKLRRKSVTSAKSALNGYQKGDCFYCYDDITILEGLDTSCDVDHFFPHILQPLVPQVNLDGVWNLVLACQPCNRGVEGKFARVPELKYLERLHRRNEYLISSHHPLRETIMQQTGYTEAERIKFLKEMDKMAINALVHRWDIEQRGEATF